MSSRALAITARVLGMAFFLYVAAAAVFGEDTLINPFLGTFYVILWVGLVPASLLLGPVFRAISPARTISMLFAKVSGVPEGEGLYVYPARLGYWPAAAGLFAFVWLELVYPYSTDVGPVRLWCAAYLGIMFIGSALWGTTFLARADPFEVYSSLVAKLSIWGRRDGVLVLRSPLANLDTVVPRPGLVMVVGVLFGSTAFDSFRESTPWLKLVQSMSTSRVWPDTLALSASRPASRSSYRRHHGDGRQERHPAPDAAQPVRALGGADHRGLHRGPLPDLLRRVRPATLIQLSDPFSRGDDFLGTADLQVNYWLSAHPTFLAVTKVARRRRWATSSAWSPPTTGRCAAAATAPAHRSAARCWWRWSRSPWAGCTCCCA